MPRLTPASFRAQLAGHRAAPPRTGARTTALLAFLACLVVGVGGLVFLLQSIGYRRGPPAVVQPPTAAGGAASNAPLRRVATSSAPSASARPGVAAVVSLPRDPLDERSAIFDPPDADAWPAVMAALAAGRARTPPSAVAAWLDDPLAPCEQAWRDTIASYAAFHAAGVAALARGDASPPKVLVYRCAERLENTFSMLLDEDCGGLADRIAGMASVFAAAVLHRRLFFVAWPAAHAVVFSRFLGNLTYDEDLVERRSGWAKAGVAARHADLSNCPELGNVCIGQMHLGPGGDGGSRAFEELMPEGVIVVRSNRPVQKEMRPDVRDALAAIGLVPATFGGCLYRALLTPTARVLAHRDALRLMERLADPGWASVGVHVRFGDGELTRVPPAAAGDAAAAAAGVAAPSPVELHSLPAWTCVDRVVGELRMAGPHPDTRPLRYLFLTDSQRVRAEAAGRLGTDTVVSTGVVPQHINKANLYSYGLYGPDGKPVEPNMLGTVERLLDAAMEWFLFAVCDYHVIPGVSGYSRLAAAYSLHNRIAMHAPTELEYMRPTCGALFDQTRFAEINGL